MIYEKCYNFKNNTKQETYILGFLFFGSINSTHFHSEDKLQSSQMRTTKYTVYLEGINNFSNPYDKYDIFFKTVFFCIARPVQLIKKNCSVVKTYIYP